MLALFVVSPGLLILAAVLAVVGLWPLAIIVALIAVYVIVRPIFGLIGLAVRRATPGAPVQPLAPTPSMRDVLYIARHPEQVVEVRHDGFHTTTVLRDGREVTVDVRRGGGAGGG